MTQKTLRFYVTPKLSLRELILNSVELDEELHARQTYLVEAKNLPQKYIPAVDSYYDFSKLDAEDTEAKGLLLEKLWDDKYELVELLHKLFEQFPVGMNKPSLA